MTKNLLVLLVPVLATFPGPSYLHADEPVPQRQLSPYRSYYFGLGFGPRWYAQPLLGPPDPNTDGLALRNVFPALELLGGVKVSRRWSLDGKFQLMDSGPLLMTRLGFHPDFLPGLSFGPSLGVGYEFGGPSPQLIAAYGFSASYDFKLTDRSSLGLDLSAAQYIPTEQRAESYSTISSTVQWKYHFD